MQHFVSASLKGLAVPLQPLNALLHPVQAVVEALPELLSLVHEVVPAFSLAAATANSSATEFLCEVPAPSSSTPFPPAVLTAWPLEVTAAASSAYE
jgi:hypothetical protein